MITQELLDYIKQQLQTGAGQDSIRSSLLANGWQEADIKEAFRQLLAGGASAPLPSGAAGVAALLSAGQLLKNSWSVYKQRIKVLLGIQLVPLLLMVIFGLLVGLLFGDSGLTGKLSSGAVPGWYIILIIILFLAILAAIFYFWLWSQVATLYAVKDRQEAIGVKEAFRRGRHRVWAYLWISALSGLVVMGGMLLLVVPGIIFSIWFAFASYVLVMEDQRGMKALLKSKEYVQGKWGGVFWRFLAIGVVFLILFVPFMIIAVLIGREWVSNILGWIASLFITPLAVIYAFLLFENLRALKPEIASVPSKSSK